MRLQPVRVYFSTMKVTLIHNPNAGNERQPSAKELTQLVRTHGYDVLYQSAEAENWTDCLDQSADLIAVAGGDGIVGNVANRVVGRTVPLAVLPLGTANNIARTLGIADIPLADLVAAWSHRRRIKIDAGVAVGPWGKANFIEGLGLGLFTQTMYRLDARDNIDLAHANDAEEKIVSVLWIMQERLESCPVKDLKLTIDGRDLSGRYLLLEAMNIKSVGPNLYLAPGADPTDGKVDIVVVRETEKETLAGYLSACIRGAPCSAVFAVHRCRHLRLEWEGSVIHIDDAVWPDKGSSVPQTPSVTIEVKVHPGALEFLTPPGVKPEI
ncbi:MAG TPA: diacylglycerol kinase family protein [Candidatus Eisenbacteria bacterium]|nr:diacylglycerol kinase family protein [Candidatus Eisenbacteria bacterium]